MEQTKCATCPYWVACDWNDRSVPIEYMCEMEENGKPCAKEGLESSEPKR